MWKADELIGRIRTDYWRKAHKSAHTGQKSMDISTWPQWRKQAVGKYQAHSWARKQGTAWRTAFIWQGIWTGKESAFFRHFLRCSKMDFRRKRCCSYFRSKRYKDRTAYRLKAWWHRRRFKRLRGYQPVQSLKGWWVRYSRPEPPFWCFLAHQRHSAYTYWAEKPSTLIYGWFQTD